ncbi:helix-turn-helix transcriptional regulator [Bradyrhizobium manausense]|uniref:helix-turn-helix transcriptional regulator n=1 Tax=Bradyrhizobium manausense TaxID=989370 RepID=UPI001BA71173|nr:helix-turn-helix transcriptional regulator [Bradyrhizobium manausense]MBR0725253.1 helix-turn-helix transcriptional regulator [Bradyrhizobium manausense]
MTRRLFDDTELTKLRVQLGEAAVDGSRWRSSLEQLCRLAGAEGASLRQSGVRTPDVPYTPSVEHLTNIYFREGWHLRDPRVSAFAKKHAKRSGAFVDGDLFTTEEFKSLLQCDPYYNDFLGANSFRWGGWIQFVAQGEPWMVALQRTQAQGAFDAGERDRLQSFSAALSEVANLSSAVGHAVLTGALDALSLVQWPALALHRSGCVLATNAAADKIFDDSVHVSHRRLEVSDGKARRKLEDFYALLRLLPETAPLAHEPIVVERPGKRSWAFNVLSVPVAARTPFLGARVLLTFRDPASPHLTKTAVLQSIFKLTEAEARLASQLAMGDRLDLVCDRLEIAKETGRTQLKSIFTKTGVNRQAELVLLVSRMS